MNWYVAICSFITGFTVAVAVIKFNRNNDARNEQLKEIFNINRQILIALISNPIKALEEKVEGLERWAEKMGRRVK